MSESIILNGLGIGVNPQLSARICLTDKLKIKNQARLATPRPGFNYGEEEPTPSRPAGGSGSI